MKWVPTKTATVFKEALGGRSGLQKTNKKSLVLFNFVLLNPLAPSYK